MTASTTTCPNCGAAIRFAWSQAVQTTCPYCKSVLIRDQMDLKRVGTVGDMPATSSPIQLGTTGVFHNRRFAVVGRVVYGYDRGSWNEWHVRFDDSGDADISAWLSDARGEYAFALATNGQETPPLDHLHVGANFVWDHRIYKLMSVTTVQYAAAEGDLPFTTWDRREATLAQLDANDGHVATLDYRGQPAALLLGEWTTFDALQFDNLREIEGWPRPA
jgi:Domain of unknown function (DUF4178)